LQVKLIRVILTFGSVGSKSILEILEAEDPAWQTTFGAKFASLMESLTADSPVELLAMRASNLMGLIVPFAMAGSMAPELAVDLTVFMHNVTPSGWDEVLGDLRACEQFETCPEAMAMFQAMTSANGLFLIYWTPTTRSCALRSRAPTSSTASTAPSFQHSLTLNNSVTFSPA